jgi:hypothetical protein
MSFQGFLLAVHVGDVDPRARVQVGVAERGVVKASAKTNSSFIDLCMTIVRAALTG